MKYFTLSALCVLTFCMLLALSGTTDITEREGRQTLGKQVGPLSTNFCNDSENAAHSPHPYVLPGWSESKSHPATITGLETLDGIIQSRTLRVIGALLLIGWIYISYKIFSSTF
jgi:hypothetical protein